MLMKIRIIIIIRPPNLPGTWACETSSAHPLTSYLLTSLTSLTSKL